MPFSDEDLIAYLLGDATDELSQRILRELAADTELVSRLNYLRTVIGQIDTLGVVFEPPADLVDTTLARIDSCIESDADQLLSPHWVTPATSSMSLSGSHEPTARRSSFWDSTALTVCLTVMCCLALPILVRVRFESRKAQCARNLSLTGADLIDYTLLSPDHRFPFVATEGPDAFAGVYAVYLKSSGVELPTSQLQCASLLGYQGGFEGKLGSIPTFEELHALAMNELKLWQRVIGGDYAYNLGVEEQGSPRAPKCEGRSQFAILSDKPVFVDDEFQLIAHDGKGINIFYEDGRVAFISTQSLYDPVSSDMRLADNPLRNQRGVHEVGLNPQDASLAPSHFPPFRQ